MHTPSINGAPRIVSLTVNLGPAKLVSASSCFVLLMNLTGNFQMMPRGFYLGYTGEYRSRYESASSLVFASGSFAGGPSLQFPQRSGCIRFPSLEFLLLTSRSSRHCQFRRSRKEPCDGCFTPPCIMSSPNQKWRRRLGIDMPTKLPTSRDLIPFKFWRWPNGDPTASSAFQQCSHNSPLNVSFRSYHLQKRYSTGTRFNFVLKLSLVLS
jgi:hypothetical protein